jgi:transposase InsO family protein
LITENLLLAALITPTADPNTQARAIAAHSMPLDAAGLRGSMSAVGNPYHNAQAESFMKTLKVEDIYPAGYETFADVAERLPQVHWRCL